MNATEWPRPIRRGPTALDIGTALIDLERACRDAHASGPDLRNTLDGYVASATLIHGRRFHTRLQAGPGRLDDVCEELAEKVRAEPTELEHRGLDADR